MITEHDLNAAIAECQGERNPNANTCIKLAAYYTIKGHLFPEPSGNSGELEHKIAEPGNGYSFAPAPVEHTIDYYSDSDFSRAIDGKDPADVWPIIDELMSTVRMIQPRLYDAVMRRLQGPS